MSAAAAMAFVAGGGRLVTIGNPSSQLSQDREAKGKIPGDRDAVLRNARTIPSEGPIDGYEAYKSAARTYPANVIPPSMVQNAKNTFLKIAKQGDPKVNNFWQLYGPLQDAIQPGVLAFSGAINATASRVTALVIAPTCVAGDCRMWAGVSGGGVWRTDDALAADPSWTWLTGVLALNSVGALVADPNDSTGNTLYVGTGEGNRCSSGCEAGVGIYKTTDGGNSWTKLPDACVNNSTYSCANSGDAFLGRGINQIVIDPTNKNHLFVGSALAVRGLSHVIGNGGTTRFEPGANEPGLYESTDGGKTFTEVWDGTKPDAGLSFGVTDVGLDPLDPSVVYAAAFDAGVWRRDAGAAATAFQQLFAPQFRMGNFVNSGIDRNMIALTVKDGHTRIYLTEGTGVSSSVTSSFAANFWRLDNANQPAAMLLASQGTCTSPDPATHTFPQTYTGWQCLTKRPTAATLEIDTANPYFATDAFCTGQCWYDQKVYTPTGMPDTVYVIGSNLYGEEPCNTNGVGCGNGRSNGREVLYSDTAGDPDGTATGAASMRTFTDLSYDATINHPSWCAFAPYFDNGCVNAPNGIHPDQHVIVINPSNPTQIFEGSDGGMIRTSGDFADVSSQCDEPHRSGGGPLDPTSGSYTACKRLLSRVPAVLQHTDRNLSSTLQFINVAINPFDPNEVLGGTQDNGTWSDLPNDDRNTFTQQIYGDGGNAVFDATQATWMANEFTSGFGDVNFKNGDPEKWVIATGPLVASGESVAFYWPQIGDPNPVTYNGQITHPIYEGAKHVWRSWAFGAGHTGNVPQDTSPDIGAAETSCPEFVTDGSTPTCGDFMPLGGLAGSNTAGDLTGTVYGADRTGGSMSWLARNKADHGTLWATTSAGRVFVTHNADASDPETVSWHRIDNATSPTRFPSSIYPDPSNVNHAWVTYSGYNAVTPTTPGHVFNVIEGSGPGSGTFTNLNVEAGTASFPTPTNEGDLPVNDIVRDDAKGMLYVATDFGVLRGDLDGTGGWHVTKGLPRFEITHLEIQPSARVPTCVGVGKKGCQTLIYAATHSQGIWQLPLGAPAP
jgi:hypothetical protein